MYIQLHSFPCNESWRNNLENLYFYKKLPPWCQLYLFNCAVQHVVATGDVTYYTDFFFGQELESYSLFEIKVKISFILLF